MSLAPRVRLGAYEVLGLIGTGGMGEVYRARDSRLGRDVAIKVLPSEFASDAERLRRFEQEARAAAALNHPNILAVYDIGQHHASPYIVSELLEGDTLRERLTGGALPVRKAIEFAVQIAHGLAAAHDKAIVHRDLKPENVFVTSDGRVKILDFGLAKLTQGARGPREESESSSAAARASGGGAPRAVMAEPALAGVSALPTTPPGTLPGVVLGTVGYMAPEQVRGLSADHRADIFAFGAILYEILSGQRAFQGETAADAMSAILAKDPPDLTDADRHIPPALARIVERCLEKSPAARFKSADDLAFALGALSTPSSTSVAPVHVGKKSRERLAWLVAGAALIVATLAVPAALYFARRGPEPIVTRLDLVTPPTINPSSFAISPDGRHLAFTANGEGGSQLWVRTLDEVTARPLAGTEGATYPFWSPDARAIGFFADAKLKRVNVAGGVPQVIAEASSGRGATWNGDGIIGLCTDGLGRADASCGHRRRPGAADAAHGRAGQPPLATVSS